MNRDRLPPSYKVRPDRAFRCQDNAPIGFPEEPPGRARPAGPDSGEDARGAAAIGPGSAGTGRMSFGLGGVAGVGSQALKQSTPAQTVRRASERHIGHPCSGTG